MRSHAFAGKRGPWEAIMTGLRLCIATLILVGPLAAFAASTSKDGILPKRGAGLVLFVSLQRQSMS